MSLSQAIQALEKFPSQASRQALIDVINQTECFYKVRLEACFCLAKVSEHILFISCLNCSSYICFSLHFTLHRRI